MKTVNVDQFDLKHGVTEAQTEPIVLTQNGEPVALLLGVNGMDEEQIQWSTSPEFWAMIQSRRKQSTIGRDELERRLPSG